MSAIPRYTYPQAVIEGELKKNWPQVLANPELTVFTIEIAVTTYPETVKKIDGLRAEWEEDHISYSRCYTVLDSKCLATPSLIADRLKELYNKQITVISLALAGPEAFLRINVAFQKDRQHCPDLTLYLAVNRDDFKVNLSNNL